MNASTESSIAARRHYVRLIHNIGGCLSLLCALSSLTLTAAQYVEVTAEIEGNDWDYWFLCDRINSYPGENGPPTIFRKGRTLHCVVGADTWMIESEWPDYKTTSWFTGTNIVEYTLNTKGDSEAAKSGLEHKLDRTSPQAGHRYTRIYDSADGNPGRPVRKADIMGFDLGATFSWLAYCSGPTLKHAGRKLYPPSAFWKESSIVYSGWLDKTERFSDSLGLPKSISLVFTNNQSIFQYQTRNITNILGWSFPLEFYGVQYLPTATNNWKLHLTVKGRVIGIGPAARPEIPPDVFSVIQK